VLVDLNTLKSLLDRIEKTNPDQITIILSISKEFDFLVRQLEVDKLAPQELLTLQALAKKQTEIVNNYKNIQLKVRDGLISIKKSKKVNDLYKI
jgi:hypothetical protein